MAPSDGRFEIPHEGIAARVLDDEAVIINLESGTYYTLTGVGAAVWELLSGGRSVDEATDHLVAQYDVQRTQLRSDLDRLVDDLLQEELLAPASDRAAAPSLSAPEGDPGEQLPYQAPTLVAYRDMAELLAIDPPQPGLADLSWDQSGSGQSSS